jgi:hypothetical protein
MTSRAATPASPRRDPGQGSRGVATSISLEELVKLQNVEPITDLDAISALWPAGGEDDEADALDDFL